jgi:hypothetical protein
MIAIIKQDKIKTAVVTTGILSWLGSLEPKRL